MKALRNKLQSRQGVSILLALAVVLVCAMVASIVLLAAATNAGKNTTVQQRNAAYYAVSSAAQLLVDDIAYEQPTAQVTQTTKTYGCQESHPSYVHSDAGLAQVDLIFTSTSGASTPFLQIIEEAMHAVDTTASGGSFERDFTIQAPGMQDVDAHFAMDEDYNIVVQLHAVNTDSFGYAATVRIAAVADDADVSTSTELDDTHMDGWEYTPEALEIPWRETTTLDPTTGTYIPASNEYGQSVEQAYPVTTTLTTTQLTWANPSITKGVDE